MQPLVLHEVSVAYAHHPVVDGISFSLESDEIGCLLGPSGCGKTSLLRAIAGFEQPRAGRIQIAGETVAGPDRWRAPEERRVGMVFQDFALFPHLNVVANIAFGLRQLSSVQREQRVRELLALMSLEAYAEAFPHQLSGGQQQRVAVARALAPKPALLLLDEPFSSIDTDLREQLAIQIRSVLKAESMAAILVTHDQQEAFAFADRIGVVHDGRLRQWASATALYQHPADAFVAEFIGRGVLIGGHLSAANSVSTALGELPCQSTVANIGQSVRVLIRPEQLAVARAEGQLATIIERRFRGACYQCRVRLAGGEMVLCQVPSAMNVTLGSELKLMFSGDGVKIFPTH